MEHIAKGNGFEERCQQICGDRNPCFIGNNKQIACISDMVINKVVIKMCPKFKDGVCDVASIEPEYVECVDENLCYKNSEYERCRLYIIDIIEYQINYRKHFAEAV